jgi:hypothetical protein
MFKGVFSLGSSKLTVQGSRFKVQGAVERIRAERFGGHRPPYKVLITSQQVEILHFVQDDKKTNFARGSTA